jgi:hypothetical protein
MSASGMSPKANALNDEANDLFGEILHGRATVEQIARFKQVVAALQDELGSDDALVSINHEALEAWEQSQENPPY